MQNHNTEHTQTVIDQSPDMPDKCTSRPNESGSFYIDGICRIFDPNTKEILVEIRA
jgi:hypothetical protein